MTQKRRTRKRSFSLVFLRTSPYLSPTCTVCSGLNILPRIKALRVTTTMATRPRCRAVTTPLVLRAQQQQHAFFCFGTVVMDGANILLRYLTMRSGVKGFTHLLQRRMFIAS